MQQRFDVISYSGSLWLIAIDAKPGETHLDVLFCSFFFFFCFPMEKQLQKTWNIAHGQSLRFLMVLFCLFLFFLLHRKRFKVIQVWNNITEGNIFWWTIPCILRNHRSCQIFSVQMSKLFICPIWFDRITHKSRRPCAALVHTAKDLRCQSSVIKIAFFFMNLFNKSYLISCVISLSISSRGDPVAAVSAISLSSDDRGFGTTANMH